PVLVQKLDALATAQTGHASLGEALAQALEEQADEAQKAQGDPKAQETAQKLAGAAAETKSAVVAMQQASSAIVPAQEQAKTMSVDPGTITPSQQEAMTHLENAIRILQPPQDQQNQDQQQKQDQKQDQNQNQQQKQDQQPVSREEAARRLQ